MKARTIMSHPDERGGAITMIQGPKGGVYTIPTSKVYQPGEEFEVIYDGKDIREVRDET